MGLAKIHMFENAPNGPLPSSGAVKLEPLWVFQMTPLRRTMMLSQGRGSRRLRHSSKQHCRQSRLQLSKSQWAGRAWTQQASLEA